MLGWVAGRQKQGGRAGQGCSAFTWLVQVLLWAPVPDWPRLREVGGGDGLYL